MTAIANVFKNIAHVDQLTLRWFSKRRHPILDRLMRLLTHAGDWQSWTALLLTGIVAGNPYRAVALKVTPKILLTFGICYVIKKVSRRPRPTAAMVDFLSLLKNPDPYSFPSSHAACAWAACASMGLVLGWGWPVWISYASLISYSRIHVGAHYPLDVLIGVCIGLSVALA
jgi:undecaprenyl-diphosphatase